MNAPNAPAAAPKPQWGIVSLAVAKATIVAAALAGIFLLLPGNWNARITLNVAGAFWLATFLFSLLTAWLRQKVTAHLAKLEL